MKQFLLTLLPALLLYSSFYAQPSTCEKSAMLLKTIEEFHFNPSKTDETFSELVYKRFIDEIDPLKMVLTPTDLQTLDAHKRLIFKEIKNKDCSLLDKIYSIYEQRLKSVYQYFLEFEKEQFNYNVEEEMDFYPKTVGTEQEIRKRWKKYIKYLVLDAYSDKNENGNKTEFEQLSDSLKMIQLRNEKKRISNRMSSPKAVKKHVGKKWLEAIAGAFDANTSYFTPLEQKVFYEELSDETLTFGFGLNKKSNQEVEITHIAPGSPAWNSNQLNEGDVIQKITVAEKAYKPQDMTMGKLTELLKSDIQTASFTIRKSTKKVIDIELSKAIIDVESNVIQSFVLENQQKFGYIYLPTFYTGDSPYFDYSEGCANDLTKNLIHLKREGIEGLILDLRSNGGGSMYEAGLMAGIFIDYGSIVQVATKDEELEVLKDMNRGTVFNKPLIVLINHFSASASELIAATLQSYNRAVIVGAPSYGKSTMQVVIPLNAYELNKYEQLGESDLGYLKVTKGAFFNVDGKTHHKTGVQPDIELPSLSHLMDFEDKDLKPQLAIEPIEPAYFKALDDLPIESLKAKSKSRIAGNAFFNTAKEKESKLANWMTNLSYPLEFSKFQKRGKAFDALFETKDETDKPSTDIQVSMPGKTAADKTVDELIKDIKTDEVIIEATHLLNDLINQK